LRLFHYIEIESFKCFGDKVRIELDHPSVLIGPNNCGKTTAIQAIALWSQAVTAWWEARRSSKASKRTAVSLNRLEILSVPVQRTRFFWHQTRVRGGAKTVYLTITVGLAHENEVKPLTMRFRNQGDDIVYCNPAETDKDTLALIEHAAGIDVALLYPMSGLESEEPVLQPGRIDVLLGQGQTAQVSRNLCAMVYNKDPDDWQQIVVLMERLFSVSLGDPLENTRGSIVLTYEQSNVKEPLDLAMAGRGFQQMLLIFAYLFSHKNSVLLIDEPDAHLEILRQKQVYVLLREIAAENASQVVLVTHSEVILDEALDDHLTLLLGGASDNLATKTEIRRSLEHFNTAHYLRARERGYVFYVEGGTDVLMLRALAERLGHPAAEAWDERLNVYYVADNHPEKDRDAELERVEGGFGITAKEHFFGLRKMLPGLQGLAILDGDRGGRNDRDAGGLEELYWRRYETENYFITPGLLLHYVREQYADLISGEDSGELDHAREILDSLVFERVFCDDEHDFKVWKEAGLDQSRLIWESMTERLKLSELAEDFFRRLSDRLAKRMLLRKGDLYRLIEYVDPGSVPREVTSKLDALTRLFEQAAELP